MIKRREMDIETLRSRLTYCAETGEFHWVQRPRELFVDDRACKAWNTRYADKPAGCLNKDGYRVIRLEDYMFLAHRLAWAYFFGVWPAEELDHINHMKTDNRIANLRESTSGGNKRNLPLRAGSKSGVTGVGWHDKYQTWNPNIRVNGKTVNLGYQKDKFEAICARKSAEVQYGFHANHGR